MTGKPSPQAAAREAITDWYNSGSTLTADDLWHRLASAGLVITAPDAPSRASGEVVISLDTANWASVAFSHAPWSDDPEVREHVRRASADLGAAIDSALATGDAP